MTDDDLRGQCREAIRLAMGSLRAARKALGLCIDCGNPTEPTKPPKLPRRYTRCQSCRVIARTRAHHSRLRDSA